MLGLGAHATYVHIDLRTARAECQIAVPAVTDLSDYKTANDVANVPAPEEDGLVGFHGSAVFMPAPVLRNTILASGSNEPFELIPMATDAVKNFDLDHEEDATMTSLKLTHAYDLNDWLYGVKMTWINKTRYQINHNDMDVRDFCREYFGQYIKGVLAT